jgi:hypothetical protein
VASRLFKETSRFFAYTTGSQDNIIVNQVYGMIGIIAIAGAVGFAILLLLYYGRKRRHCYILALKFNGLNSINKI